MGEDEQEEFKQKIDSYKQGLHVNWFIDAARLKTGDSFGEKALLEDQPRAATIVTLKTSYFAVLDRASFRNCLMKIENREKNKKIAFLRNLPIFNLWTGNQIYKMTYFFGEKSFNINQVVYRQNEPSDYIYVVK